MRFTQADTFTFIDANGNQFTVRDNLPIGTYDILDVCPIKATDELDEIISRPEYYGDGNEDLNYAIVDLNAEVLIENNFDLTNIKQLNIPVIINT